MPAIDAMNDKPDVFSCDVDTVSITVAEAMARIMQAIEPIKGCESVALKSALGRVVGDDVVSPVDVPNHTNSAMDGYAFCGSGLPVSGDRQFRVAGTALAGSPYHGQVNADECVRIMTGAVMPEGTDSVVMQERVQVDSGQVTVSAGEKPGANVRHAGEDIHSGDVVVGKGTRIGASQLGVLASLGLPQVRVVQRPRVAYFSNGDELRAVGMPLALGEVYDSNRYTLSSMLNGLCVEPVDLGVVRDDPDMIAKVITEATHEADLIISTAGASVGEADYIRDILGRLGQVAFWKVAVKPGRPLSFGKLGESLFFGLPGNPVSVMVTFQIFVKPAISKLAGEAEFLEPRLSMKTVSDLKKRPGRMEYQRGIMSVDASGEAIVSSTGEQGSGILSSMSQANCFIILPDDSDGAKAGDWVQVKPFPNGM
ncbi:MAG: molybdopterin molybdotransferase MoeA [Gammaproteobacteria bacterium]|nr:molybdopterin molybdotransferase MoeA [Gammaproteobacteria bacterium]